MRKNLYTLSHHLWQFVGKVSLFIESTLTYINQGWWYLPCCWPMDRHFRVWLAGQWAQGCMWIGVLPISGNSCAHIFLFLIFVEDLIYVPVTSGPVRECIVWKPIKRKQIKQLEKALPSAVLWFKNKCKVCFILHLAYFHLIYTYSWMFAFYLKFVPSYLVHFGNYNFLFCLIAIKLCL